MGVKSYFKRLIKYVLHESKQPIIYANIAERKQDKIHDNKVYVVTGGGSGLGFYMAKSLIKSGAKVIITGRKEENLKNAVNSLGNNCKYYLMDVCDIQSSKDTLKKIFDEYKNIDGIINNAGISLHEKDILDVSEENFDAQINTNLKGAYFLAQSYIELYEKNKQQSGNILFISSERGSMCDDLPYGLSKIAINSLTEALSRRYYKKGIRVNAIAPGVTCSGLNNKDKDGDLYLDNSAGRFLVPEEIAEVVNFILSDYALSISGEIINCDAGNHIRAYFE